MYRKRRRVIMNIVNNMYTGRSIANMVTPLHFWLLMRCSSSKSDFSNISKNRVYTFLRFFCSTEGMPYRVDIKAPVFQNMTTSLLNS